MWGATVCSTLEGAEAAVPARTAEQRSKSLGQELPPAEEEERAALVSAARGREFAARSKCDVESGSGFTLDAHLGNGWWPDKCEGASGC